VGGIPALLCAITMCPYATCPAYAQRPTIQVEVDLVRVPLVAVGRNGNPLHDLHRQELALFDDGVRQDIQYLWTEVDLPLKVGLLMDISKSEGVRVVRAYRNSAKWFAFHIIGPSDSVLLSTAHEQPRFLTDFTASPDELSRAADRISYQGRTGAAFGEPCLPSGSLKDHSAAGCTGTPIWDGVFHLAHSEFIHIQGRKALVLLSDGMDLSSSVHGLSSAIEAAEAAGVTVYTVKCTDFCLPSVMSESSDVVLPLRIVQSLGDHGMEEIAVRTGGRAFVQPRKIETVFQKIEEDLRNQYVLAYTPKSPPVRGSRHRLEVRITRPHVQLRVPAEYRAP
jgi:VWFA-related protein